MVSAWLIEFGNETYISQPDQGGAYAIAAKRLATDLRGSGVGVLIQAEGSVSDETLRQVCMHITAAVPRPRGISSSDIPADVVDKERRFRIEQAMESGKPKEIAEKMVEGKINKLYIELALLEQDFVVDPTKKVKDLSDNDLEKIRDQIAKFTIEGDLRREVQGNIRRLIEINSYRGFRHRRNLPVNGQRTKSNARTRRGRRARFRGRATSRRPRRAA